MRHGSNIDPPNRFETVHQEADLEHLEWDQEHLRTLTHRRIEYVFDSSRSIVSENKSPDIPFRYSVNPYRGCGHGCAYCYARPGHEFLGFNAGLDFETKIVVSAMRRNCCVSSCPGMAGSRSRSRSPASPIVISRREAPNFG